MNAFAPQQKYLPHQRSAGEKNIGRNAHIFLRKIPPAFKIKSRVSIAKKYRIKEPSTKKYRALFSIWSEKFFGSLYRQISLIYYNPLHKRRAIQSHILYRNLLIYK